MHKISTCPTSQEWQRLAVGLLPDAEAELLELHLAECNACLATVRSIPPSDTLVDAMSAKSTSVETADKAIVEKLVTAMKALNESSDTPAPAAEQPAAGNAVSGETFPTAALVPDTVDLELDFLAPAQSADEMGRLGAYRILKVLGSGGMGMVFLAEDSQLGRSVALKVMKPSLAKIASARQRFLQEARLAAGIEHDHIVPIFQVGEDRGVPFLAMQLLKGVSLDELLRRSGRLPLPQVLRIGIQIAEGLAAAHARGLIHRDIKPGNIWIESVRGGRVKILDFGLARPQQSNAQITQSGVIVGTPAYMAPEQARGEKNLDLRVDLFSLGCVLYLMSTGRMAFAGNDPVGVLMAVQMQEPTPPRDVNPDMPPILADLVVKLLAKEPGKRPASAEEVLKTLQSLERGLSAAQSTAGVELLSAISAAANPPSATVATPNEPSNPFAHLSSVASRVVAGSPDPATLATEGLPDPATTGDLRSDPVARSGDRATTGLPTSKPGRAQRKRGVMLAITAAAAAMVLAAAGIVFFLQSPDGVVRFEINDPAIRVEIIQEDGVKLTGADKQTITVKPGKHGLTITRGDDFKFDTTTFQLKKRDKTTLKIDWFEGKGMVVAQDGAKIDEKAAPPLQTAKAASTGKYVLEFDGAKAFVKFPSLRLDDIGAKGSDEPHTAETWLQFPNGIPTGSGNILVWGGTHQTTTLFIQAQQLGAYHQKSGNADGNLLNPVDVKGEDQFVHMAAVWDGQEAQVYINGQRTGSFRPKRGALFGTNYITSLGALVDAGSTHAPQRDFARVRIASVRFSIAARYRANFTPEKRFKADAQTVALYNCDEGQGDVLKDSSGNEHHGKIVGAKWIQVVAPGAFAAVGETSTPRSSYALAFDGERSHVDIPSLKAQPDDPLTIEVWARPQRTDPERSKVSAPYGAVVFAMEHAKGTQQLSAGQAENNWIAVRSDLGVWLPQPLEIDKAVHLAHVFDGQEVRFFVDGKLVKRAGRGQAIAQGPRTPGAWMGGYNKLAPFAGVVGETRISRSARYDKNFTPAQRFDLDAYTLALYHFDEGQGDVLKDSSGNNHHGKIVGAKWVKTEGSELVMPRYALAFDGKTFVRVESASLDLSQPFTIEGYLTQTGTIPLKKGNLPGPLVSFNRVFISAGPSWGFLVIGKTDKKMDHHLEYKSLQNNRRTHVAGVSTGRQLLLFVDGKRVASQDMAGNPPAQIRIPVELGGWFVGLVSEVRVSQSARYDKDFTPQARFEPDADTLALYHMNEGQGDVLKDSSGNNHHGKIVGAKWVKAIDLSPQDVSTKVAQQRNSLAPLPPNTGGSAVRTSGSGVQLDTSSISLNARNTWTVEAWVTPREPVPRGGEAALVLMVDPVWIALRNGEKWALGGPTSRPAPTIYASGKLEVGKPAHLAMSRGPQGVSFFVNGVREGEPLPIVFAVGQGWLRVCPMGDPKRRDVGFHGDIDELRVSSVDRYQGNFTPQTRFEPDADTLALYHFDEGQGDKLTDSSGHGHHGKIVGAKWVKADGAPLPTLPQTDQTFALSFDGQSRVDASDIPWGKLAPFTFEAIARPAAAGPFGQVVDRFKISTMGFNNGKWFFAVKPQPNAAPVRVDATETAPLGKRVHLAGVYAGNEIRLYVDGVLAGSAPAPVATTLELGQQLTLGKSFVGAIEGVRISSGARYEKGFTSPDRLTKDDTTLALYRFDEGEGELLKDSSGNGHHGKIVGAKW